jgi:hypothetical protein
VQRRLPVSAVDGEVTISQNGNEIKPTVSAVDKRIHDQDRRVASSSS